MDELGREQIESFLQELGEEVGKKLKTPVRIMLIGGAYMILFLQNREFTEDIDVFPLNFAISTEPSKETKSFFTAVRAVARRYQLKRTWLNDSAATMLGGLGPDPELDLWAQFGLLEVYRPPLDFILALKIFADRGKDSPDLDALIQALNISSRSELQAVTDKYIYPRWQQEYHVHRTIHNLSRRLKLP
jgi:hypothetical protein